MKILMKCFVEFCLCVCGGVLIFFPLRFAVSMPEPEIQYMHFFLLSYNRDSCINCNIRLSGPLNETVFEPVCSVQQPTVSLIGSSVW